MTSAAGRQTGDRRVTVGVSPRAALASHARLFMALEQAFGVRFASRDEPGAPCDALILVGDGNVPAVEDAAAFGVPVLALGTPAQPVAAQERVTLGDGSAIDPRLRGLVLIDQSPAPELAPAAAETVLAWSAAGPAWTAATATARVDRLRGSLPLLGDGDVLRQGFRVTGSLALLALVQLLRALDPVRWTPPRLRATFLFDDPNLRRPRYGHIDYRALLAHADAHDYHAAMAMIPLDVRRASRDAVATFRGRPDRLSLVMHGNDHVHHELMQPMGHEAALALGAQALRRMARFERATGVAVERVMTPPHGRCSRTMARALAELGYEALCAIHPAPWTQDTPPDRLLAGWSPAEFIEGCAALPRFPFTVWPTEIALRAFLDQPLVLYGHHDDVADGLEPLEVATARVNRLGDVRWGSIARLARASYAVCVDDGVARVRPWARRLSVDLPAGAEQVVVASPPGGPATGLRGWTVDADPAGQPRTFDVPYRTGGQRQLELTLRPAKSADPAEVPLPPVRPWPVVRRRATEMRDRLAPRWPAKG